MLSRIPKHSTKAIRTSLRAIGTSLAQSRSLDPNKRIIVRLEFVSPKLKFVRNQISELMLPPELMLPLK